MFTHYASAEIVSRAALAAAFRARDLLGTVGSAATSGRDSNYEPTFRSFSYRRFSSVSGFTRCKSFSERATHA